MKIKFILGDEKTIINQTVKVTTQILGIIDGRERPLLEAAAQDIADKFIPGADWAFSNFQFLPDGFTFRINATTRIDSSQNDQLDQRAQEISEKGKLTLTLANLDVSIPLFQRREAESELRVMLIEKARGEASKLGGRVVKVDFVPSDEAPIYSNSRQMAMAASSYAADAPGGGGVSLGHSEKLVIQAVISVEVDSGERQKLNG